MLLLSTPVSIHERLGQVFLRIDSVVLHTVTVSAYNVARLCFSCDKTDNLFDALSSVFLSFFSLSAGCGLVSFSLKCFDNG